jgi:uncharacterized protein
VAQQTPREIPSLNLARILRGGGDASGQGETTQLQLVREPVHPEDPPEIIDIALSGPVKWRATVTHVGGDEFWLAGRVQGTAIMECARCLEATLVPVDGKLESMMLHRPGVVTPHLEIGEDEGDIIVFGDPTIDLSPFLAEAFAVEMPPTVLHSPDCRGLCSLCGANLNGVPEGSCAVGREDCPHTEHGKELDPSNPFAKLRGLIED